MTKPKDHIATTVYCLNQLPNPIYITIQSFLSVLHLVRIKSGSITLFYNSSFFCMYAFFILFSTKINVTTDEIDIKASIEDMISLLYPLLSKARSNNGTIYTRNAASINIIIHIIVTNAKRLVTLIP